MSRLDLLAFFGLIRGFETDHHRLVQAAEGLFDADGVSLFLQGRDGSVFQLAAASGIAASIPGDATIISGEGIAGRAIAKRQPALLDDSTPPTDTTLRRAELESAIIVPLYTSTRTVGVLNFSRGAGRNRFEVDDLRLAETLGVALSFLFANALHVHEIEEEREKLRRILELHGLAALVFDDELLLSDANDGGRTLVGDADHWDAVSRMLPGPISRFVDDSVASEEQASQAVVRTESGRYHLAFRRLGTTGFALTIQDVTELERLRQAAEQNQRLAEIGQMTAAVAHEIRNPLTSLMTAGQMLQSEPQMAMELGGMVQEEATKLNELCNEFLAFAKPIRITRSEVHLNSLVARVVEAHRDEADRQSVGLLFIAEGDLPMIYSDAARIEQIVHNLVLNAIQACQPGQTVRVLLGREGIRVEDNGKGISEEAMGRLFTPFFTTRASGTGLGLSNVKRIADAMGGQIRVHALNPGTCFEVVLESEAA